MRIENITFAIESSLIKKVLLEELEKKYCFKEKNLINGDFGGAFNKVCSISDNKNSLVGKFMRINSYHSKISKKSEDASILNYEYEIHNELYENDVRVAKPENVFLVNKERFLNPFGKIYFPGLVMQDLGRLTLDKLGGNVKKKAQEMIDIELKKAIELGFIPFHDSRNEGNSIWFEEQVYLIDFTFWKRKK